MSFSLIQKVSVKVLFFLVLFIPMVVDAHVPNIIVQDSLKDIELVTDPELSQAFYGQLIGFPHTYEIRATEPFTLYAEILLPDIDSSKNNVSGIIIKEQRAGGRVEEVTRLRAREATWETTYEPFGGDTYRKGQSFEAEVGPGVYRIEVNTPDNIEKYVLVLGKREEMTLGYFELIGRIIEVKVFFDKPKWRAIESPFIYVPLVIFAIGVLAFFIWKRKRREEIS